MPTSEARLTANRQNAAKSTGPRTPEGKAISRANSLKHGQTGAGIVVPVEDQAEVEQRFAEFADELQPTGSLGLTLVRRAATMAVRMEHASERELAAVAERVVQALVEFEAPEGVDDAEAARLRVEAARLAAFDPSKEACLARRYEAAAERSFYRALKEFRQVEKQARGATLAAEPAPVRPPLGSFFPVAPPRSACDLPPASKPVRPVSTSQNLPANPGFDLPITIGQRR